MFTLFNINKWNNYNEWPKQRTKFLYHLFYFLILLLLTPNFFAFNKLIHNIFRQDLSQTLSECHTNLNKFENYITAQIVALSVENILKFIIQLYSNKACPWYFRNVWKLKTNSFYCRSNNDLLRNKCFVQLE